MAFVNAKAHGIGAFRHVTTRKFNECQPLIFKLLEPGPDLGEDPSPPPTIACIFARCRAK